MADFDGTDQVDTSAEVTPTDSGPAEQQTSSGGNPAWDSIRSKLDPTLFAHIEPDLKNFDQNAEKRISGLNSQLGQYKEFGSPEQINNWRTVAQRIDAEPEVIYQALGQFLQDNGRLPQTAKEVAQVQADADEQGDGEQQADDPRIAQIMQNQEQMRSFLEQQETQRMAQEADASLDQEIGQLQTAYPQFDKQDIKEVLQRAAFQAQTTGQVPALAQVAQDYLDNTVNRIRSIPRPGDSAPRLLPTSGGGVPQGQQQPSLGQRSRQDVQDLVAGLLSQGNRG